MKKNAIGIIMSFIVFAANHICLAQSKNIRNYINESSLEKNNNDSLNKTSINEEIIAEQPLADIIKGNNRSYKSPLITNAVTPYSYWVGAKLGYNVNVKDGGTDNIVGGASIIINSVKEKYLKANWDIVGNIGNFTTSGSEDETQKKLAKIAQSQSGLSVGIAATWSFNTGTSEEFTWRPYLLTGYKLNTFTLTVKEGVSADTESPSTSLNQWHNLAGIEFEGFNFTQKGKLHIAVAGSLDFFDKQTYYKAVQKSKSNLASLNATVIFPLSEKFGFMIDGIYSNQFSPIYSIGIIIKSDKLSSAL